MIRLVHNLGGCGGTLLSRCLGVLPRVALFSEINPLSVNLFAPFHPLYQDREWVQLLKEQDYETFLNVDLTQPTDSVASSSAFTVAVPNQAGIWF